MRHKETMFKLWAKQMRHEIFYGSSKGGVIHNTAKTKIHYHPVQNTWFGIEIKKIFIVVYGLYEITSYM